MNLINFDNAFRHFQEVIKEKEKVTYDLNNRIDFNQHRYASLLLNTDFMPKLWFFAFKKDFYNSFGKEFEGEEGKGESINTDFLMHIFKFINSEQFRDIRLFFSYPDGKIYYINPKKILEIGHKRETTAENKSVYSFNIKHLMRYNTDGKETITQTHQTSQELVI